MKEELFRTEPHIASSQAVSSARKRNILAIGLFALVLNILTIGLFALVLFASQRHALARLPLSSSPELSFLRGADGRASAFAHSSLATKPLLDEAKPGRPVLFDFVVANLEKINGVGNKIRSETIKHWSGMGDNIAREWDKMGDNVVREWDKITSSLTNVFSREQRQGTRKLDTRKLDEVLQSFQSVLHGNEIDMAQLLKALRAHLILMKSGGAALRIVAKDLEANLHKAESLFSKLPPEKGWHLASLLETERESGIHDGSILKDDSAAMGLLWVRRSLAFQLELYASLILKDGKHPSDAATDAYSKTLRPYHGWMLQKVSSFSWSQLPDRDVFIAKFGGKEADELDQESEDEIVKKLKRLLAVWRPIIETWRNDFARLDLEDTRRA